MFLERMREKPSHSEVTDFYNFMPEMMSITSAILYLLEMRARESTEYEYRRGDHCRPPQGLPPPTTIESAWQ
jgi:hypothetical protein